MRPHFYTHYIAKCDQTVKFLQGVIIDAETGEFSAGSSSDYSIGLINIEQNGKLFINGQFPTADMLKSFVAFYDKSEKLISTFAISQYANEIISAPIEAVYYGIYIQASTAATKAYVNTNFLYLVHAVSPVYKSLTKTIERESEQIFFREKLNGELTFRRKDYDLLKDSTLNDSFLLLIYEGQNVAGMASFNTDFNADYARENILTTGTLYYKGSFKLTDLAINYSKHSISLKNITTEDNYSTILSRLDDTYDLVKLAPKLSSIELSKRPLTQVYIAGASTITNSIAGTYWESEVDESIDDEDKLINTYHFARVKEYVELNFDSIIPSSVLTDEKVTISKSYSVGDVIFSKHLGNEYYLQITAAKPQYSSNQGLYHLGIADKNGTWIYSNKHTTNLITNGTYSAYNILTTFDSNFEYKGSSSAYPKTMKMFAIKQTLFRRILLDASIENITDSEGVKYTYDITLDDFAASNSNYKRCIGLTGGSYWATFVTTSTPTRYGVNDAGEYFTDDFIPSSTGLSKMRLIPVSRSEWCNMSIWMEYASTNTYNSDAGLADLSEQCTKTYTLNDAYFIIDVLKAILAEIDSSIIVDDLSRHRFLRQNMVNPVTGDYIGIYLTQKTNIKNGEYDQPAQKAEITLGELFEMLKTCFNCYWSITNVLGNKYLTIEHKSYYDNGKSYTGEPSIEIDLREEVDQFNKQTALYAQNEKTFDTSKLYHRFEMKWNEGCTELFGPMYLTTAAEYAKDSTLKTLVPNRIVSDIDYLLANPSAFSDDGFVLMCTRSKKVPVIEREYITDTSKEYKASIQNYYASWPYLVNFHLLDCPSKHLMCDTPIDGIDVDTKLTTQGLSYLETQSIEFPLGNDPDMYKNIITDLGVGHPKRCEINIETRQCKIELEFKRYE